MNSLSIITFAWEDKYIGCVIEDPEYDKIGGENILRCILWKYTGQELIRLGPHVFYEEDEVDAISFDIPENTILRDYNDL